MIGEILRVWIIAPDQHKSLYNVHLNYNTTLASCLATQIDRILVVIIVF